MLATTTGVDFNNGAKGTIYTVPTGKSCIVHSIVIRAASGDLHLNQNSFGFNGAATDVIANAAYANLTGGTVYIRVSSKDASTVGTSGQIFGLFCNSTNTAGTVTIDVFGYLI